MADRNRNLLGLSIVATVLMIISFGKVAYGQCLTSPINTVVYEGTQNAILSCGLGPQGEGWAVRPTSNVAKEYQITSFTDSVSSTLRQLYAVNQSGLIVRNATIDRTGGPISTAGLYYVYFADGNKTALKLVVIRSGPDCSYTQSASKSTIITCTIIYSDHPVSLMNATVSCAADGRVYTAPPTKTLLSPYLYRSTTTMIANNSSTSTYDCRAAFTAPLDSRTTYLSKNEPKFTVNITAAEAPPTTPLSTTPRPTTRPLTGTLTRRPTNTAAVAGSSDIILECASSYGTDAISWSFTPLGSFNNETIQVSNGFKLLTTNQQKYVLRATVSSSVIIVRQLSSLTEGTYSCYDGVETAKALLLVIPSPISMEPLFGPVSGGTNITIIGSSIIDASSRYISSYLPKIRDVRTVYIGNDLSAASLFLLPNGSSTIDVVAVTPSTTKQSIGQPLPIIIEFSPTLLNITPFNVTFNRAFNYLPDPEITGIYPDSFIVNGGILVDVTGRSLSSVAKPIIQLTVFITRAAENSATSTTSTSRICTVPQGDDTFMQCPMPPLNLPNDFLEKLNSLYSTSVSRRRRSIWSVNQPTADSERHLSRLKRDVNVLTVRGPNGVDRADIYLGFILDGYREYENINDDLPDTKFIFYSAPEINSSNQLIEFDPTKDELINVKGKYMLRGCRLRDYVVHIGNQVCNNSDLQDNQLSCRPPKEKPSPTEYDTINCDQHLSIMISVGYKQYQYACLKYTEHPASNANTGQSGTNRVALIVGLTVGLVGFAILLTILIVCICRWRRNKVSQFTDEGQGPGRQEIRNRQYNTFNDKMAPTSHLHWRPRYGDDDTNEEYLWNYDGPGEEIEA